MEIPGVGSLRLAAIAMLCAALAAPARAQTHPTVDRTVAPPGETSPSAPAAAAGKVAVPGPVIPAQGPPPRRRRAQQTADAPGPAGAVAAPGTAGAPGAVGPAAAASSSAAAGAAPPRPGEQGAAGSPAPVPPSSPGAAAPSSAGLPGAATPAAATGPTAAAAALNAAGAARYGILLPPEKSADLEKHWAARREYLRDRDERRAEDEEQRVRQLKDDLAIDNLFTISSALVRESQEALAASSPALARKRCKLAVDLAPALPDAHGCLARAIFAEEGFASIKPAFAEATQGFKASFADPRVSRARLANAGTVLLLGLLLASLAFVALLFARYAQLYGHDVHHLFPAGARTWQTRLLATVLVLSPLLLQMGPVPLLFTALAACALYASTVEVGVGVAVLIILTAAPFAAEGLAHLAAFGGPAADVYLIETGEGGSGPSARLQRRLEGGNGEFAVAFSLAHKAKREGDLGAAETLYRRALETPGNGGESLSAARNNLGNVYLMGGDAQRAIVQYTQAIELQDSSAAAHFNLSRALGLGGVESLEKVQAEQARALELDRDLIDGFTGGSLQVNRKANRFVMDVQLPDGSLDPLVAVESVIASPVGDEARAALGGPLPPTLAPLLPLLAGLVFVGLHFLRTRLKPSGRCERCGREVCKRCDADARPSEALCAQCVNVFVRRHNVDPTERIRKEVAVHLYQRRRTVTLRLLGVLSGAGHVLMGYPLRGLVFLLLTGCLLASVLLWRGVAHDPIAVRSGISFLRVGITAAIFVAIYGLCLRDLIARQRAEGG